MTQELCECPICEGTDEDCETCKGTGLVERRLVVEAYGAYDDAIDFAKNRCHTCKGSGTWPGTDTICWNCHGSGQENYREKKHD